MENFKSGAAIDTRSDKEKIKDHKFREFVASVNPVNWVKKAQELWRKFPIFNQDGSGSCVMQTQCKEMGIMRFLKDGIYVHFSVGDGYQRRVNKPASGMGVVDARSIGKEGITLEVLVPSQNMSDAELDAIVVDQYKRQVGQVFSVPNYVEDPRDIETIASIIQTTKKGVMVWFYFQYDEWTDRPKVINTSLDLYADSTCRHSVTAVDFILTDDGKKALIIEDSWGPNFGKAGQRIIDEDFFKARNWYAGHLVNFKFDEQTIPKPQHTFNIDLDPWITNPEVKFLQDVLKYEGLFPLNADSTGYFGSATLKGVQAFQVKHNIIAVGAPGYGRVGPRTRSVLNQIYG